MKQIANETDKEKRSELEKGLYRKVGDKESIFHNIKRDENGKLDVDLSLPNEKYVNSKGEEAIFNKKTGEWINDGLNSATYNIAGWEGLSKPSASLDFIPHMYFDSNDVNLWVEYGIGPEDSLTREERKEIGSKKIGILKNLIIKSMGDNAKKNLEDRIKNNL